MPIGLAERDQTIFTYLVRRPEPADFRPFLQRHAELLRALPKWKVRLVFPGHLTRCESLYRSVLREELLMPIRLGVVDELRWYFEQKSAAAMDNRVPDSERFRAAIPRASTSFCRIISIARRHEPTVGCTDQASSSLTMDAVLVP